MELLFCIFIAICIFMSFKTVVVACLQKNFLSFETIIIITYLYFSLFVGFGMIYLICMQSNLLVLIEAGNLISGDYFDKLITSLYFSAVTLFSVGYGDIVPIGIGRYLAVIEALIGYVLPVVFLARTVIEVEKK
ncbi:ion channel [Metabacillus rhizolycopersici]|uniref:Two pore domain potassium channel family protein n=1 Tax=Metabacillus rhizolycopersici TaxID=2875709 RepID=A0ABS7UZB3_9BACI|nr:ion channel [Metabacillus rhizolycopersici]MBZ5753667.1 two pore domain potassium channel family protein [Metabacillus rhizolycopersici]